MSAPHAARREDGGVAESTWLDRDVPILEAVAHLECSVAPGEAIGVEEVATSAQLEGDEVVRGVLALLDGGYLDGRTLRGDGRIMAVRGISLRERGRRAVGGWPTETGGLEAFLELLSDRIDEVVDEEEKSRLRKLRDAAQGVGREVGTAVLVAWAKSVAGLP